ncbi:MAG: hypothetical protein R2860_13710 [Desulfobacterales bacterium]
MPIYEYTALNAKGKTVHDIIDSDSMAAARRSCGPEASTRHP